MKDISYPVPRRSSRTVSATLQALAKTAETRDDNVVLWVGANCDQGNIVMFTAAVEDRGLFLQLDSNYRFMGQAAEELAQVANDRKELDLLVDRRLDTFRAIHRSALVEAAQKALDRNFPSIAEEILKIPFYL